MVSNAIKSAQTQVEAQNFEIRKNVLKYDEVMNRQRVVIYEERRRVLEGEDLHDQIGHMIDDTVEALRRRPPPREGYPEEWDLDQLWTALGTLYPVGLTVDELEDESGGGRDGLTPEFLVERAAGRRPRRVRRRGRRSSAPRSCASSSAASCCRCSTASGASTSTRWTTCRRASGCARWRSVTRWSSTSARATTCSPP